MRILIFILFSISLNAQKAELLEMLKGKLEATYTFVSKNKDTIYLDYYSNRLFIERRIFRHDYDSIDAEMLGLQQHSIDTFKKAYFVDDNRNDFSYISIRGNEYYGNCPILRLLTYRLQSEPFHQNDYNVNIGYLLSIDEYSLTRYIKEESIKVNKEEFCAYKFENEGEGPGCIIRKEIYIDIKDYIPIYSKIYVIYPSGTTKSTEIKIIDIKYYPK